MHEQKNSYASPNESKVTQILNKNTHSHYTETQTIKTKIIETIIMHAYSMLVLMGGQKEI